MSNDDLIARRQDRYSHFERGITVTGETRLGDGGNTNYTRFRQDGTMRAMGSAACWEDLRIEPVARGTGVNNPAFEQYFTDGAGSRGVYLYSFTDAGAGNEKEIYFTMQMPHAWKGTTIHIHVHWVGNNADAAANPRWGLEYTWTDIGSDFANTVPIYSTSEKVGAGGVADPDVTPGRHYLTELPDITPSATQDGLSSILIGRLFRDSADAGDTYNVAANKCGLLYIDAHYEVDALWSADEYSKE